MANNTQFSAQQRIAELKEMITKKGNRPELRRMSLDDYIVLYSENRVRAAVVYAILKGVLRNEPCEECGNIRTVAHHDNYNRPLTIRWLCRSHHALWHSSNKAVKLEESLMALLPSEYYEIGIKGLDRDK